MFVVAQSALCANVKLDNTETDSKQQPDARLQMKVLLRLLGAAEIVEFNAFNPIYLRRTKLLRLIMCNESL